MHAYRLAQAGDRPPSWQLSTRLIREFECLGSTRYVLSLCNSAARLDHAQAGSSPEQSRTAVGLLLYEYRVNILAFRQDHVHIADSLVDFNSVTPVEIKSEPASVSPSGALQVASVLPGFIP